MGSEQRDSGGCAAEAGPDIGRLHFQGSGAVLVVRADEVAMAAQDKFGVTIPDEEIKNLKTVGDAVGFIAKNS